MNYEDKYFFDRLFRLYGEENVEKLKKAHIMLFGLGGVGSWAAEALARSAIGKITLVDFDIINETNINRQMPALSNTIGIEKVKIAADRLSKINPEIKVIPRNIRLMPENTEEILADMPSVVIDAVDNVTAKCFLINYCRANKIPIIVSCGSGGRADPSKVKIEDLGETENDALARVVRGILRKKYNFPKKGKFGIQAICSSEIACKPFAGLKPNETKNTIVENCNEAKRSSMILGTACFVTGTFGFFCAAAAIGKILGK